LTSCAQGSKLGLFPDEGETNYLPGMRSALADPYVVFYRVGTDAIEIIRVLHGRRDIASLFARRADG
jgi:toxin ParE1/3/4